MDKRNGFCSKTLASFLLIVCLASGCSKKESSSTESSNGGNGQSGFEVTPPPDSATGDPANPTDPGLDPNDGSENEYNFVLNNGVGYTNGMELQFAVVAPVSVKSIKVGQTNDCSDGTIENYKTSFVKPVFKRNAVNKVSLQFISFSGSIGACVVKSIVQDDEGPDVVISQYPMANLGESSNTELKYSVTDVSLVKEVYCSLNEVTKPCAAGDAIVKLTNLAEGNYVFKVSAKDIFGFTSEKSVSWKVVSTIKYINQVVNIKDDRKVDILIVVDNSNSMQYEQRSMAKRVSNMLAILKGLDWQIAITTTDPRNVTLGDGRLIPIYGTNGALILKSGTMSDSDAQSKLGMTIQRPEVGSSSEQAINATYRFIERAMGKDTAYRKFFRDGSNLAVLVISDEDESDNKFRNDPANLMALISTSFNQQKVFSWHSIITKPGDTQCKKTYGATYGERLAKFSQFTGGVIGSVCEADYAAQVTGIANNIVDMNKVITLSCQALPDYPITIKKDGVAYTIPFVRDGVNLKFNNILEPGSYSIDYTCLK